MAPALLKLPGNPPWGVLISLCLELSRPLTPLDQLIINGINLPFAPDI